MGKDDVGDLPRFPKKKKALERALPEWLARWAAGENATGREAELAQAERDRRKALRPDERVCVVVGREGVTPEQQASLVDAIRARRPTELHYARLPSRLHQQIKDFAPVTVHSVEQEAIKAADFVVGAPRETYTPERKTGVWGQVKYAKHRGLPVLVIMPDGKEGVHGK